MRVESGPSRTVETVSSMFALLCEETWPSSLPNSLIDADGRTMSPDALGTSSALRKTVCVTSVTKWPLPSLPENVLLAGLATSPVALPTIFWSG